MSLSDERLRQILQRARLYPDRASQLRERHARLLFAARFIAAEAAEVMQERCAKVCDEMAEQLVRKAQDKENVIYDVRADAIRDL